MGKPIATVSRIKESHLLLKKENVRMSGTGGCNVFNGTSDRKA
jgi:hypothetical protein